MARIRLACAVVCLPVVMFGAVFFGTASADDQVAEFEVTVEAGKHDRQNVPVVVEMTTTEQYLPWNWHDVKLLSGDQPIEGQATMPGLDNEPLHREPVVKISGSAAVAVTLAAGIPRELHFVVPELKAGATAKFKLRLPQPPTSASALEPTFYFKPEGGDARGLYFRNGNERPLLKYVHPKLDESSKEAREQTYKPFHHVYAPDGSRIVTKGPGGKYTHHRGIYFGFNKVIYGNGQTCDVWHCKAPSYQNHERVANEEAGHVLGRQRVAIGWHGAKGEKFADEQRELTAFEMPNLQVIHFTSVVRTVDGPIKLDGDPQHAGFHFRADNEVADKTAKQTYYLRPDGQGKPGETRNWDSKSRNPAAVNEPWKVMSFVLGDVRYSALYLDHPDNPKEARSSERDYGRFGSYFEYEVTKDKPLKVNYRLILKAGEFTAEEAQRLSNDFVDPPKVTIKRMMKSE